ncbi:MAG: triose-phosphate isomerase [Candidatus Eisenbacteria bacterium]
MQRRPLVAGNWKMNKTAKDTRRFLITLRNRLTGMSPGADVLVCPPFVSLETAVDAARGTSIAIGAQNTSWQADGALTGEVAPEMLEDIGVTHALIGHSERRGVFGETDDHVNRKLLHVLSGSLTPVVCVGEVLAEREAGETEAVVRRQVQGALANVAPDHAPRIVMAYEPVWAIGTGLTASPEMANEVHVLIRGAIAAIFGQSVADGTRILYGGSVKPDNAGNLLAESDVDGVLVGGASLDPGSFAGIIAAAG